MPDLGPTVTTGPNDEDPREDISPLEDRVNAHVRQRDYLTRFESRIQLKH
jgi:hypothetical protein